MVNLLGSGVADRFTGGVDDRRPFPNRLALEASDKRSFLGAFLPVDDNRRSVANLGATGMVKPEVLGFGREGFLVAFCGSAVVVGFGLVFLASSFFLAWMRFSRSAILALIFANRSCSIRSIFSFRSFFSKAFLVTASSLPLFALRCAAMRFRTRSRAFLCSTSGLTFVCCLVSSTLPALLDAVGLDKRSKALFG